MIGQRIRLEQATFSYPRPEHGAEYDLLFSCPLQFKAAQSSLLFHSRYLNMPLLQDERTLKRFLERSPADLLSRPDDGDSLSSRCGVCSAATVHAGLTWNRWPRTCTSARRRCVGICVRRVRAFRNSKTSCAGTLRFITWGVRSVVAADCRAVGVFRAFGVSSGVQEVDRIDAGGLPRPGELNFQSLYLRCIYRPLRRQARSHRNLCGHIICERQ